MIEFKSTAGKLNDASDSNVQFFCGALVRSNSDALPQSAANALGKLFEAAGIQKQTESAIRSDYLVNKELSFKHTDFSGGDYYLIWGYTASLTGNLFAEETTAGVG